MSIYEKLVETLYLADDVRVEDILQDPLVDGEVLGVYVKSSILENRVCSVIVSVIGEFMVEFKYNRRVESVEEFYENFTCVPQITNGIEEEGKTCELISIVRQFRKLSPL